MTEGKLLNVCTVWWVEEAFGGQHRGFRDHPLQLPLHELSPGIVDFSVLTVPVPLALPKKPKLTEPQEMMQPLADLCGQLGDALPPHALEYPWYYYELLDRDERVKPLCWIAPELLYRDFPDDRERPVQRVGPWEILGENPYPRRLLTMDDLHRKPPDDDGDVLEREMWREWLVATWGANESDWQEQGLLTHDTVRPWSSMLGFSEVLSGDAAEDFDEWQSMRKGYAPLHLSRAALGDGGLYWKMVPLYDERDLQRIWWAMKQDLYATSAFNLAAGSQQDKHLWRRLDERFQLRYRRMSRYKYLIAMREQCVLEWTKRKKTLDQIAQLLVDEKLHPLDPAGPLFAHPVAEGHREANLSSARQVAVRIRGRLHREGVLEKLPPGRPRRKPDVE